MKLQIFLSFRHHFPRRSFASMGKHSLERKSWSEIESSSNSHSLGLDDLVSSLSIDIVFTPGYSDPQCRSQRPLIETCSHQQSIICYLFAFILLSSLDFSNGNS